VKSDSQQAAGAASGIAIFGIFGAFTMFSNSGFLSRVTGGGGGRVLDIENPLQDMMQQQSGSQFHMLVVGVFLCLMLYVGASYLIWIQAFKRPTVDEKEKRGGLLPPHKH
jgi:hypothetical protein